MSRTEPSGRRVAITGLGIASPVGVGVTSFWEALTAGESGVGPITLFDASEYAVQFAAEVSDFEPDDWFERNNARRFDRFAQLFVASAEQAIDDADLDFDQEDPERIGSITGNGVGGLMSMEAGKETLMERGPRRLTPFVVPQMMPNAACGEIAIRYGLRGANFSTASACAASTHAIGMAYRLIKHGEVDVMVTGGSEAAICGLGVGGFAKMRALSRRNDAPREASRPFDADRDGFVLGEGGGALVIEELEHAKARGAEIHGLVGGFGMTDDGHHMTAPEPEGRGATRAMRLAVEEAGIDPEMVGYINAHGTSTEYNDRIETAAIKAAFGHHAEELAISSTKSMTGHLLGGAGALEGVATALAIREGVLPPTINLDTPDPDCDLDYVPRDARETELEAALSNSFGFGGHNASLLLMRYTGN